MTTQVTTHGELRIVLPGTWLRVPLGTDAELRSFAKDAVAKAVGRADRLAALRRDAVTRIVDLGRQTRDSGAHTLVMATELVPGVPFSASLVGRDDPWPAAPEGGAGEGDAARLAAAFPEEELVPLQCGPAIRSRSSGTLRGKDEEMASVIVSYRVARPDTDALLHLRFTAPDPGMGDHLSAFFHAIADSVEFTRRSLDASPLAE